MTLGRTLDMHHTGHLDGPPVTTSHWFPAAGTHTASYCRTALFVEESSKPGAFGSTKGSRT
jgi:hypothetical protein